MLPPVPARVAVLTVLVLAAGCQPQGPEALRRGDELRRAGRAEEAVPLLERAATDLPGDARAWNFLGLAYHAAHRPADAQKAYLRALREDRNLFDVHYNLGALQAEQEDWAEAERSLRTFLAPDANHNQAAAWSRLGTVQLQLRKLDDAERSLALAAKLDPENAGVWNSLGLVYVSKRRLPAARQNFAWAVRLDPHHAAARLNLAVTSQQLGDRRGAAQHYRDYLAMAPGAANAGEVRALLQQIDAPVAAAPLPSSPAAGAKPLTNTALSAPKVAVPTNAAATKPAPPPVKPAVDAHPPVPKPPASQAAPPVVQNPKPSAADSPPPPQPEVVRVAEGPALRPARDVVSAEGPAVLRSPLATSLPATNALAAEPVPDQPPAPLPPAPKRRPTFWQRANPVRWGNPVKWFGSSPAAAPTPAPALPRPAVVSAAPPIPSAPVPKPQPPKPIVARYQSRAPAGLPAGDRTAAEAQFNSAAAAHGRRELAAAIALYQLAVELDAAYFAAHYNLGLAALESGDGPRALLAGDCATRLEPQSGPARRLFAAALQRANYPADAAGQLERLLTGEPDDAAAHLTLAGLYARALGEPAMARPHYERVLALDPQHPQAAAIRRWLAENP